MGIIPAGSPYEAWEYNRNDWMRIFFDKKYYPMYYLRRIGISENTLSQGELDNIALAVYDQVVALYDWIVSSMLMQSELPFTESISIGFSETVKFLITDQLAQAMDVKNFRQNQKGIAAHIAASATFGREDDDDDDEDGPQQLDNPFKKGT